MELEPPGAGAFGWSRHFGPALVPTPASIKGRVEGRWGGWGLAWFGPTATLKASIPMMAVGKKKFEIVYSYQNVFKIVFNNKLFSIKHCFLC